MTAAGPDYRWAMAAPEGRLAGELSRYLLAGGLSAALSLSLPVLFKAGLGIAPNLAVGMSLAIVFAINFGVIRTFVFRSRGRAGHQLLRFALTTAVMRGIEYVAFLGVHVLLGVHYWVALFLVLCVSSTCKFVVQRRFVFGVG